MYKVLDVSIAGFWQKFRVESAFREDVNVVIGKNGTGKTTFMNILHAVLAVDADALFESDFTSATIRLVDGDSVRTIKAEKRETGNSPFPVIVYQISRKKYFATLFSGDVPPSFRRRVAEETGRIKAELSKLVSLASLSVYRIGTELDVDARERPLKRIVSPVDMRLANLTQRLTHYQLELSNLARQISSELQRDVLISLLYRPERPEKVKTVGYALEFDENQERQNLASAYKQLGLSGTDVAKRIQEHTSSIARTVKAIKEEIKKPDSDLSPIDFTPLEARTRTAGVVELSLAAEQKTKAIFKQIDLFLGTLRGFISDKQFTFVGGDLSISKDGGFPISKLSSGEKQLLILLIEALLQKQHPYIFLADEPELSLHIAWQRQIISAIRALNPNAQIIVATHSPEVAGRFKNSILDMEDILHV